MSQKSKSMLEFQAHICWVITVDYKVRSGQVKSEFKLEKSKIDSFRSGLEIVRIFPKIQQCATYTKALKDGPTKSKSWRHFRYFGG